MAILVCSSCGREFEAGDASASAKPACPDCQKWGGTFATSKPAEPAGSSGVCGICLTPIVSGESASACPACAAVYHEECWRENKGCAVYGCPEAPKVEQRSSLEIPVSYWGQENKPCPACGREILAAAIRCRFCGATFASARPEDSGAFSHRAEMEKRLPQVRKTVIRIFVLSVVPFTAPIGGIWGLVWLPSNRADVDALPSLYSALCKIGIVVGLGQTVLLILLTILYSITRGS